ncbi:MAG: cobalamin biosynthesis protein CbiL [Gammaproteobacteria bacterium]|nr:cobalamin biosynthesis protein CbiL [Gammaproteobacteria bacterium]
MIRLLLTAVIVLVSIQPALAHKLKVFATVDGKQVSGYAFFIGGGRAMGAEWRAIAGEDTLLAEGRTDAEGRFSLVPPQPVTDTVRITVDTEEGHIASTVLPAARFGSVTAPLSAPASNAATDKSTADATPTDDSREIARLVDAAVQRQIQPLLERIEAMDSRLRFTDILSGLFLIAGLAGLALWARGRGGGGVP